MRGYFSFKGHNYGVGTVVKVCQKHQDKFDFYSYVIFDKCNFENETYRFRSRCSVWDRYDIPKDKLEEYIEQITQPCEIDNQVCFSPKVEEDYIEGIASAWIWYILIMIGAIFLKGIGNMLGVWIIASVIFFSWRSKKKNGG